jgi:hypothetical protein
MLCQVGTPERVIRLASRILAQPMRQEGVTEFITAVVIVVVTMVVRSG